MKVFLNFVIKEIYHILRDFRTLLVLFGIPIAQLVIFGYAIRTEINDISIGILDHSRDELTTKLTDKILSSGYFKLGAVIRSENDIEPAFKAGKVRQVIIMEDNFSKRLTKEGKANILIINDASNPNFATLSNAYASSIINDFRQSLAKGARQAPAITSEIKMLYNPSMRSVFMFVPGLIAMLLMLISTLMTSVSITREKEFGNMEVLLVSPLRPLIIIVGKVVPYVALAFINGISILILARTVFGVPLNGSLPLLLGEMVIYVVTCLSLGILISTVAKSQQIAMVLSLVGLLMPTLLLSGFIYPVENMPYLLQLLSNVIPATWFLVILKGIMLKGVGLEVLWKETLILGFMAVFFLVVSMKKFKIRLD